MGKHPTVKNFSEIIVIATWRNCDYLSHLPTLFYEYGNSNGDGSTFKRPSPQDPNGNEKTPLHDFMAISIADSDGLNASELLKLTSY